MKKGLLRTLSAVVAISMLFCMSMVAFADMTTTASITTYVGENVTVETTVAGAEASEQVAFLVEKTDNETTKIVWIDQQTADAEGKAKSKFTAKAADAVDAKVRFGTSSIPSSNDTTKTIAWDEYEITWNVTTNNSTTPSKVLVTVDALGFADDTNENSETLSQEGQAITFYVFPAPDEELKTINGETPDVIGNSFTYALTADATYDFVFGAKEFEDDAETSATALVGDSTPATSDLKKASVAASAANATEYGIVVAKRGYVFNAGEVPSLTSNGGEGVTAIKLPALGANSAGQFVIEIDDTVSQSFFVNNIKYVAKVYAIRDGVAVLSDDTFELN